MRTLYLDCGMGAAGDMLTAALLELLPEPGKMVERLNRLGIPDVEYRLEPAEKCGITGSQVRVLVHGEEESCGDDHHDHDGHHHHDHHHDHDHDHDHHDDHDEHHAHHHDHDEQHHEHHHDDHHHSHRTLGQIRDVVEKLPVDPKVKEDILTVYTLIAEAEGHVHGKPVEEIHFHEVGTLDAVADVTAVSLILHELAPEQIIVSPVHVGSGQVKCAHGTLPVPAPATAYILRDIPIYGGKIRGELCTPTGAALLKTFATRFGDMPVLRTTAIGYGMGKKDFEAANCVRAILGETEGSPEKDEKGNSRYISGEVPEGRKGTILSLSCNVDDMTAEEIGFAMDRLFAGGAREVFTLPVGMKKNRPGTLLQVICDENDREKFLELLFRHTTTLGVREQVMNRYTLDRRIETVETPYGPVRRKASEGYGVTRVKWEYDDLARIAEKTGKSLGELRAELSE